MQYVISEDSITVLPLSARSVNCMRRAGVHTIGDMLDYPAEEWGNIRNMGAKSVEEVQNCIQYLINGTSDFCLVDKEFKTELFQNGVQDKVAAESEENQDWTKIILDSDNNIVRDIPIAQMAFPTRAMNSLVGAGVCYVSEIMGKTVADLLEYPNMGKKTAESVAEKINEIQFEYEGNWVENDVAQDNSASDSILTELIAAYGGSQAVYLREILETKTKYPEASGEVWIYRLYESKIIAESLKLTILRKLEENEDGISKNTLESLLPNHLNNTTILEEMLLELESNALITVGEVMLYRRWPSAMDYVNSLPEGRDREMTRARILGLTLDEIGKQFDVTRERVRQITKREWSHRPKLREDIYLYLFEHYNISKEDFLLAFDEAEETYYYLEVVGTYTNDQRKVFDEEVLKDSKISIRMRKQLEKAIYKNYIMLDGTYIKRIRPNLVKYVVKNFCKDLTKYDDFHQLYHMQLEEWGLSEEESLRLDSRAYENHLNAADYVLWNQWRSFRYYNIHETDYDDLLTAINLDQYENVELSALKFFRDYPELMKQYDIRDEYELHNLLKKISREEKNWHFKKMPTIEIGTPDRDAQVYNLLLQYSPISIEDLGKRYEEEYGVKALTAMGTYFKGIDRYFYQGMYTVDVPELPQDRIKFLQGMLTDDFYWVSEIKRLYKQEYPHSNIEDINPHTLKTLGFRVFPSSTGYVVKNTYSSASDYFRSMLVDNGICDMREKNRQLCYLPTYTSELYQLRNQYDIIEFSPLQYISIRRLNEANITKQDLLDYCEAIAGRYEKGEYFTIESLRQDGFIHPLDDLGFGEWFYSSVLLEDKKNFSYQRIGGTRLFLKGKQGAQFSDMLQNLLEKYQKMDLYDLMELLDDRYGIHLPKDKIVETIRGTNLYYDTIMEAVYLDYDTYFEEI